MFLCFLCYNRGDDGVEDIDVAGMNAKSDNIQVKREEERVDNLGFPSGSKYITIDDFVFGNNLFHFDYQCIQVRIDGVDDSELPLICYPIKYLNDAAIESDVEWFRNTIITQYTDNGKHDWDEIAKLYHIRNKEKKNKNNKNESENKNNKEKDNSNDNSKDNSNDNSKDNSNENCNDNSNDNSNGRMISLSLTPSPEPLTQTTLFSEPTIDNSKSQLSLSSFNQYKSEKWDDLLFTARYESVKGFDKMIYKFEKINYFNHKVNVDLPHGYNGSVFEKIYDFRFAMGDKHFDLEYDGVLNLTMLDDIKQLINKDLIITIDYITTLDDILNNIIQVFHFMVRNTYIKHVYEALKNKENDSSYLNLTYSSYFKNYKSNMNRDNWIDMLANAYEIHFSRVNYSWSDKAALPLKFNSFPIAVYEGRTGKDQAIAIINAIEKYYTKIMDELKYVLFFIHTMFRVEKSFILS